MGNSETFPNDSNEISFTTFFLSTALSRIHVVRGILRQTIKKDLTRYFFLVFRCFKFNLVYNYNTLVHAFFHRIFLVLGIVRGFDVETDYLYLITPLPEEALRRVVVIKMSSSVQLPQAFYKNHVDRSNGSYPYMNYKKFADKLNQPMRKTSSRLRYVCDDQSTSFD